jgi:hypothetical protein
VPPKETELVLANPEKKKRSDRLDLDNQLGNYVLEPEPGELTNATRNHAQQKKDFRAWLGDEYVLSSKTQKRMDRFYSDMQALEPTDGDRESIDQSQSKLLNYQVHQRNRDHMKNTLPLPNLMLIDELGPNNNNQEEFNKMFTKHLS